MRVEMGKHAGFCFGVKSAVEKALEACRDGAECWVLGSLIHNPQVTRMLESAGLRMAESVEDIPGGTVLLRSHGTSPALLSRIAARGLSVVDATCPHVLRVHELVKKYSADGSLVIIAGRPDHPEVRATAAWCAGPVRIVESAEAARAMEPQDRALLVAQTTLTQREWQEITAQVRKRVPDLTVANTICHATEVRQREAEALAGRVDVMLVVGGRESANTRALYDTCRARCARTYFVESAEEIPKGVSAFDTIGITAGASTPEWSLKEVATRMNDMELTYPQGTEGQPVAGVEAEPSAADVTAEAETPVAVAEEEQETPAVEAEQNSPAAQETEQEAPAAEAEGQEAPEADPPAAEETAPRPAAKPAHGEPGENSFMADVEATLVTIRPGQTITGTVVQVTDEEICVNIGYKSDGLVKRSDLVTTEVAVGDEIDVEVVKVNDGEGNVLLSQRNIVNRRNWEAILAQFDNEEYVVGVGREAVKGGLIASVNGIRAFIPASQLSQRYVERIEDFVGKEVKLKIIEVDKAKKRIVCSRKAVILEEASARKREIWDRLVEGSVVTGIVRRLTDFGAFVDIGGVDGLVHVTDLSWGRVRHPSEVVSPNKEISVKILSIDPERERIQLGYKQTQPRPWDVAEEKYPAGSIVEGKVVRITTFGAFVELEPGLDGLVHISQCALTRIAKVEDAVQVGQVIRAKVLSVDSQAKRIGLSIRAALEEEAFNYSSFIPGDGVMPGETPEDEPYAVPVDYSQMSAQPQEPEAQEPPEAEA